VTHLRKTMLEELQRRNLSERTAESYVRAVEEFARFHKRPPDRLGPEESASIRRICSPIENSMPTPSVNTSRHFASSHQNPEAPLDRRGDALSEAGDSIARRHEQGRSRAAHRLRRQPAAQGLAVDLYATGMRREELVQLKVETSTAHGC